MLTTETIIIIISFFLLFVSIAFILYMLYSFADLIDYRSRRNKLLIAAQTILLSFSHNNNDEQALRELCSAIDSYSKTNKQFSNSYKTIDGLLEQYILLLNSNSITIHFKDVSVLSLKESANKLLDIYRSKLSNQPSYTDPLINDIATCIKTNQLAKAFEYIRLLDTKLSKIADNKRKKFIEFLNPFATILAAVLTVVLSHFIS